MRFITNRPTVSIFSLSIFTITVLFTFHSPVNAANATGQTRFSGQTPLQTLALAAKERSVGGGTADLDAGDVFDPMRVILAARFGLERVVRTLLDQGASVNARDNAGNTALMGAAGEGREKIIKLLLRRGASVGAKNKNGDTALKFAAEKGHLPVMNLLLSAGSDVNNAGQQGETALIAAIRYGHIDAALLLLDNGASPSARMQGGRFDEGGDYTPLMFVARHGLLDRDIDGNWSGLAQALIDKGADPSVRRWNGEDALAIAREHGMSDVVALLEHASGSDGSRQMARATSSGASHINPVQLFVAIKYGHAGEVESLLSQGVSVNATDGVGKSALTVAAEGGQKQIVELLLSKDADVNKRSYQGWQPLMAAAGSGHADIVKTLLAAGADVRAANNRDETALHEGVKSGSAAVVRLLLESGAPVDAQSLADRHDATGSFTALMYAAQRGSRGGQGDWQEIAQLLLDNGANANIKRPNGETALAIARKQNHPELVALLAPQDGGEAVASSAAAAAPVVSGRAAPQILQVARFGQQAALRSLLRDGADVESRDDAGNSALIVAAGAGHAAVVDMLLQAGADSNAANSDGDTALIAAAEKGYVDVLRALNSAGGDIQHKNEIGESALFVALKYGHIDAATLLLELGASPNIQSKERRFSETSNYTPLMYAARHGLLGSDGDWASVVRLMLDSGADVNVKRPNTDTALSIAKSYGDASVVDLLSGAGAEVGKPVFISPTYADGRTSKIKQAFSSKE
ncbi:MAG: hypothetical protein GXP10_00370, partial [Gammaproteobacteria bacterium]|nr:hypothetical protein [Gammaproteobacteria bacterium]